MKTKAFIAAFAGVTIAGALCSCMDFHQFDEMSIDSVVVEKGYERQAYLSHSWDSALHTRIKDSMTSVMSIWRVETAANTVVFEKTVHPQLTASSKLLKEEYELSAELLNAPVQKTYLHRATDSDGAELDTVYIALADGQEIWYTIKITNHTGRVNASEYAFGSLILLKAIYRGAKNVLLEKSITGDTYKTTYQTSLFLKEKYVSNPQTFEVQIYAYALRKVPSNKPKSEFSVTVKNRYRTPLDSLTEMLRFTEVFSYAAGNVSNVEIALILDRRFSGNNFSWQTHDFAYKRTGSNGVTTGTETFVEKRGNWSIYARTDSYSAPFENDVIIDTLSSRFNFYHQRAVYEDEYVKVEFGYEAIRVIEVKTEVTRHSNVTASLYNRINTIYLGFGQDLENNISLYR